jgi:hypothetical protein
LKKLFFRGDSEGMAFMTRVPMAPMTRSGMVYARYMVGEDDSGKRRRLFLYEKDAVFINKEEDLGEPEDDEYFELIPEAEGIEFSYLKGPGDKDADAEWQDEWDPDSDTGLPLAVMITLYENEDVAPICVIARLQVEPDQETYERHNKK